MGIYTEKENNTYKDREGVVNYAFRDPCKYDEYGDYDKYIWHYKSKAELIDHFSNKLGRLVIERELEFVKQESYWKQPFVNRVLVSGLYVGDIDVIPPDLDPEHARLAEKLFKDQKKKQSRVPYKEAERKRDREFMFRMQKLFKKDPRISQRISADLNRRLMASFGRDN